MIVLDASAAIELLLRRTAYERVSEIVLAEGEVAHAPYLLDAEVVQVLRRFESSGTIDSARAADALDDYIALRLIRHGHSVFLDRIWSLRHNLTAYDALYVALAEALDAPLVTLDRGLLAAPGHGARVKLCE